MFPERLTALDKDGIRRLLGFTVDVAADDDVAVAGGNSFDDDDNDDDCRLYSFIGCSNDDEACSDVDDPVFIIPCN